MDRTELAASLAGAFGVGIAGLLDVLDERGLYDEFVDAFGAGRLRVALDLDGCHVVEQQPATLVAN
jgi:hypothetical protein